MVSSLGFVVWDLRFMGLGLVVAVRVLRIGVQVLGSGIEG